MIAVSGKKAFARNFRFAENEKIFSFDAQPE
jgi:hypothetical protein